VGGIDLEVKGAPAQFFCRADDLFQQARTDSLTSPGGFPIERLFGTKSLYEIVATRALAGKNWSPTGKITPKARKKEKL
jgi:hypothetical protein